MQKIERNRLVFLDLKNRPLTHHKVPKYVFKELFSGYRVVEKIFLHFIRDLRQKLGGVTLWSFPLFPLYGRHREGGNFL